MASSAHSSVNPSSTDAHKPKEHVDQSSSTQHMAAMDHPTVQAATTAFTNSLSDEASQAAAVSAQVFATVELLEIILLGLPPRTLLLCQRVSKRWQAAIQTSTKIQQLLFFKPLPGDSLDPDEVARTQHALLINTLLTPLISSLFGLWLYSHHFESGADDLLSRRLPRWKYSEASWRRMIPTHPRLTAPFSVEFHKCGAGDDGSCLEDNEQLTEQTMGRILEEIVSGAQHLLAIHGGKIERVTVNFAVYAHAIQRIRLDSEGQLDDTEAWYKEWMQDGENEERSG